MLTRKAIVPLIIVTLLLALVPSSFAAQDQVTLIV
jgi:hypothetical protein